MNEQRLSDLEFYVGNLRKALFIAGVGFILLSIGSIPEIRDRDKDRIRNIIVLYNNKLITKNALIGTLHHEGLDHHKWQKKFINRVAQEDIYE